MADHITLGNLIGLIIEELTSTFEQTRNPADLYEWYASDVPIPQELLSLQVDDIELEFPAHIHLGSNRFSASKPTQLMLTLPSPLESLPTGRLGRVRITIKPEQRSLPEEELYLQKDRE